MNKWLISFSLLLSVHGLFAKPLNYTISPVRNSSEMIIALRVELQFAGDDDGSTEIHLPTQYAGTFHLNRCVSRMRCLGAQSLFMQGDSSVAVAVHAPGAPLRLIYEVQQMVGNPDFTADGGAPFAPLVGNNGFHLIGAAFLLYPESSDGYSVTAGWEGFPKDWPIRNSYATENNPKQCWQSSDKTWLSAVFTGGKLWRSSAATLHEHNVQLLVNGSNWRFPDTALIGAIGQVLRCEEDFWADYDRPGYTVVLMPLDNHEKTQVWFTGSALHHALVIYADPARVDSVEALQHFIYHEIMHEWLGGKIKNGGPSNDMQYAWFSEGFTEYFALMNEWRCGFIDSEKYTSTIKNEYVNALKNSPVAQISNKEVAKSFFENPEVRRLPYLRGFVFARELDALIERQSRGKQHLKDVLMEIMQEFERKNYTVYDHPDDLFQKLSAAAGMDVKERYLEIYD